MTAFSTVLIGEESLLVGCADILADRGHAIRAVVSRNPEIRAWAERQGLPALDRPGDLAGHFAPGGFDWLLSIANLQLIPEEVLALAARGGINFHDGPLPRYAGLNAPVWALIAGEAAHGVTWHLMEGGVDKGDILEQARVEIAADETAFSLNSKCYAAGLESFGALVSQLESGVLARQPQNLAERSYVGRDKRPAAAGRLDFHRPAADLARLVRALDFGGYPNPLLCPKIEVAGRVLRVSGAEVAEGAGAPGAVLDFGPDWLVVATGEAALRLTGLAALDGALPEFRGGMRLASPAPDEAARLEAAVAGTLRGEPHWAAALAGMQPVSLPLAGRAAGAAPDWAHRVLTLPGGLAGPALVAAVAAWALRSGGEEAGALAYRDAAVAAAAARAPGYVSAWVPLALSAETGFAALEAGIAAQMAEAAAFGGFAADLPARIPAIGAAPVPPVGIALDEEAPVPGTLLTISLGGGRAVLHHDATRLSEGAAALLANRLESLALHLARPGAEGTPVAALPVLPASERARILGDWNRSARDYDRGLTVHRAVADQARRTPEAAALVFEDRELSYAELETRADALARSLVALGVGPGSHVGLFVDRSPDLVIGALAILKAGGAYVPIDPAYPADRVAHYLADSAAKVVLTQAALEPRLPDTTAAVLRIEEAGIEGAETVDGGATADDLAYLIYTSGSTGTPKGVMVEHRNVANFFAGMDDRVEHGPGGVWLAVTSLSFDISVLELFWTLARGFKVVLTGGEHRAVVSGGPIAVSDRRIDFNLMYWGNDDGPGPKKYELLLEGAKFADAHGFNAVWTPERHFHAFGGPYPNPSVTGAAVAAVTKNLAVRAGSCVAPLHHPARIAEEWAVIDNLTAGRTGLGIASGWQPDDFILRPENTPPANKPAMYEAIETLRRLWRGEKIAFPRKDGSLHEVITQPRPVSKELGIWVTTAGNPETWREAGQIGANVLTHLLGQSIEEVAGKIRIYHAALREAGHDPADFTVTLMLHTYLAETREAAAEVARGPMKEYLRSAAGLIKQYAWVFPAFKKPKGVNNAFEMDLGILGEDEMDAILDFAFQRYFEDSGLFGTVEDGVARIEQLKRIGVDEVACLIDYGIAPEVVLEGLKPLAEVLRRVQAPSELAADDFSLAAQIVRHGVTHLQCTPSMARLIAMNDEARMAMGRVRHLLLGGEALPAELVEELRECTGAAIQNMYGPTETTIWSTSAPVAGAVQGIVDIGTPIANTSVYVLDAAGEPAPVGVPGELCIGGEGVTRGYWQRPELTAERFVPDPFAAEAGLTIAAAPRMYRTGDLARWREDGRLAFLGRSDHQVKIRGQRIELGEIESALAACPGVRAAVVLARETAGDTRLVGYVTASAPVDEAALRAELAEHLPEVMVPARIVTLDAFPLTPNKKIDRKALPDPAPRAAAAAPAAETGADTPAEAGPEAGPEGGIEAGIREIWARILGVQEIRPGDSFFDLGGHSLLAVQAHREIREKLKLPKLSITDIFRFPTLRGLATHAGKGAERPEPAREPEPALADAPDRGETMSRRRAMRAGRQDRG